MSSSVLIVEDNPLNLELAQDILEAQGYEVISAGNADECFSILQIRLPDLVLMDIQLPGKDGLQITRELRANPDTKDLLIVAMTASAMVEDRQRVLEAGCDGYLTKPIQTRSLADEVDRFISRRQSGAIPSSLESGSAESHLLEPVPDRPAAH